MSESQLLTAEEMAEIEARANAATPGPWKRIASLSIDSCVESEARYEDGVPYLCADVSGLLARPDADFIAHAPTDIRRLLDTVRGLLAERAQATATLVRLEAAVDRLGANVATAAKLTHENNEQTAKLARALTEALDGWEYEATRTREYVREEPSAAEAIARLRQEVTR